MEAKISVVMSVHNGELYLQESIESILGQTFRDFEFIIINDASTDRSRQVIESYNDSRIRLINNEENLGLTRNLNKGIDLATGKYVARMDADDIAMPQRFAHQFAFLESHPDYGLCSTWARTFGAYDIPLNFPTRDEKLKCCLLFQNPIVHPTVMFRTNVVRDVRYDESLRVAQDFDLWHRIAQHTRIACLPEYLLMYRVHNSSTSATKSEAQEKVRNDIFKSYLNQLGIEPTEKEMGIHNSMSQVKSKKEELDINYLPDMYLWMQRIIRQNRQRKVFDQDALKDVLCFRWLLSCYFTQSYKLLMQAPFYWPLKSLYPASKLLWEKRKK